MPHTRTIERTAFCQFCPDADEVTEVLQMLGFRLTFQMGVVKSPASLKLPPLPAQYHYRDAYGNEVIYLAGQEKDEEGEQAPSHASRFWFSSGADRVACERVARVLTRRWSLTWLGRLPQGNRASTPGGRPPGRNAMGRDTPIRLHREKGTRHT